MAQFDDMPSGAQIVSVPQSQQQTQGQQFSDLPEGAQVVSAPTPSEPSTLSKAGKFATDTLKNFGAGALQTVEGLGELGNKAIHNPNMLRASMDSIFPGASAAIPDEDLHKLADIISPNAGMEAEKRYAEPYTNLTGSKASKLIGYGGESLMEFLTGDEALKALSLGDRLLKAGKIAKVLEESPRLMEALQKGTTLQKLALKYPRIAELVQSSARAGAVQAGETLAKTGGDVKEAAKQGAEMAGTSGLIGAPLTAAGALLSKGSKAANTVNKMAEVGANAPSREAITNSAQQMVKNANELMHREYENGVQQLGNWLIGKTINHAGSPLEKAAQEILEVGKSQEKPFAKEIGDTIPGSAPVKKLVSAMAGESAEGAEQSAGTSLEGGLINSAGGDVTAGTDVAEASKPTYDINDLVEMRQRLGKRMRDLPFDDPDRKIYGKLIQGVDDTVKEMAQQADNPNVAKRLDEMNATYRQKIKLFQNKDVQALMRGNINDIADRLARGETSIDDIRAVRKTVGAANMGKLGDDIFSRWVADASPDGKFDPELLLKKWNKLKPEVRDELFSLDDPKNTPQFRDWFGKSKAVEPNGNPKVLYHGTRTPTDFDEFSTSGPPTDDMGQAADTGSGADPTAYLGAHFAENPRTANMFAEGKGWTASKVAENDARGRVMPVYLRVENAKDFGSEANLHDFINEGKINDEYALNHAMEADGIDPDSPQGEKWLEKYDSDPKFRKEQNQYIIDQANNFAESMDGESIARDLADQAKSRLKEEGYDGLKYDNQVEGGKAWVAFEPEQIKSAIGNSGAFDKTSGSLTDAGKEAAKQGFKEAMKAVGQSAATKKLIKVGVLTGGAGAVWGPLGAMIGFLMNKEGASGVGQLIDYVANHPYMWNSLKAFNKVAESGAASQANRLVRYGAGKEVTNLRHIVSGARSSLSGTGNQ